jgi:excinuclease ABC subunit A
MTELNDHLKLLYSRAAQLHCRGCGAHVKRDTAESIVAEIARRVQADGQTDVRLIVTFPVPVPHNFTEQEVVALLEKQGYTRIHARHESIVADDSGNRKSRKKPKTRTRVVLEMIQDRLRFDAEDSARLSEAIEAALRVGQGRVSVQVMDARERAAEGQQAAGAHPVHVWRFSADLHCPDCDIHYQEPSPSLFSFNSALGACESCRGFGRIIGVDFGLIVPDESKTLANGAIRPWQTESYRECQDDLISFARKRDIPIDVPWSKLTQLQRDWVLEGEGEWKKNVWYGVRRFFKWLETRAYKMHIRVLLSKYRAYTPCMTCNGARLKTDALLWRLGTNADAAIAHERFRPNGVQWSEAALAALPGLSVHELMLLPIDRCRKFFEALRLPAPLDEAADLVLREIRHRLTYLMDVGLGYLTLDRQSRTLSGGEVQRINLTTALGTSLVNTLFVLDEPSIGLHPRDMGRVIGVMQRLKEAGNSLVVVEHDPQVMQAADRLLDIGPGPGTHGGEIVFYDTPDKLASAQRSLTADYLLGRKHVGVLAQAPGAVAAERGGVARHLTLRGASQHNLKRIDLSIPLNELVCVTGVSGSGKSTLIQDVLHPALLRYFGKPTETPGTFDALEGAQHLTGVVMVDQSPIGRTTRSNPASYVGAFDAIRKLFATEPMAKERNYTIGTFSFNSGNGRCPACGGNGFEHVEMQFLSDVYLRCPDCDGRRYRAEILDVRLTRLVPAADKANAPTIADVLDMTVAQAVEFFAGEATVLQTLQPLAEVGLDYLKLGQAVPTLSGGEAQRLKLAGYLAANASAGGPGTVNGRKKASSRPSSARSVSQATLFLFDEPTTGLHFDDIAKLLRSFRRLIAAGHSVLVIEHNLDVIGAADWLVDLGPEGGDAGGEVVAAGTPDHVMQHSTSHTGKALREYREAAGSWLAGGNAIAEGAAFYSACGSSPITRHSSPPASISIHGAREHNLKIIDVELPRDRFTVVTGVSGSGKSTLAFDIVFGEGQRRYLESLNAYARQFVQPASRPDVDAIFGIPPTVAIEQRTSRGGRKSTVATLTEIHHFLRLLYVKLGTQYCPSCDVAIEPQSFDAIVARILRNYRNKHVTLLAPLVVARKGIYKDLAAWANKKGFAQLRVDGELLSTRKWPRLDRFKEHTIELPLATSSVTAKTERELRRDLELALEHGKGVVRVLESSGKDNGTVFSTRRACPSCGTSFAELDPRLFSFNSRLGWCEGCYGTGLAMEGFDAQQSGEEGAWLDDGDGEPQVCTSCHGDRLNPIALHVRFNSQSIAAATNQPVATLRRTFAKLRLEGRSQEIARDVLAEINSRLAFLEDVGLGYLQLSRAAPTLSGGETQRIRLAAQLGSNLQGVCYILDEPTIGLHPRDNNVLLDTLDKLADKGNSLLVVEHDEDTIRRADYVIDLGPGAGSRGGRVVAAGTAEELARSSESVTGRFLSRPLQHPLAPRRAVNPRGPALIIREATLHNLGEKSVRVPLGRLVVVSGVSGSGKSTLARDVLHDNLHAVLGDRRSTPRWQGCKDISGWEAIERILEVDQTPVGKTPRSCPATYVGFWDQIRRVFAETPEARMRGYEPTRFSFNTAGGRCEACEGQGMQKIEMNFLPDVRVGCDVCRGQRFNQETLSIKYKGRSIGEVLLMSVDEAVQFFAAHPRVHHALRLLQDVGLGYLTLGQQSPTLSGGEAQRIKLVTELARVRDGMRMNEAHAGTLYVLDEPTVGLHMADVEKLIHVLHRLVDAGNSVVVIEHNLDVMAEADWLIDMGPEGGDGGGHIVAQGTPEDVARTKGKSHTAKILKGFLRERGKSGA